MRIRAREAVTAKKTEGQHVTFAKKLYLCAIKLNAMKTRSIKALTLLTVYLLSTVGAACLAIGCHCPHSIYNHSARHSIATCSSGHCCHTYHHDVLDNLSGLLRLQPAEECCHHNHSTDTELYTADGNESANIRITATYTDVIASAYNISDAPLTALEKAFAERRCPPAQKCRAVLKPLRAPPVCA